MGPDFENAGPRERAGAAAPAAAPPFPCPESIISDTTPKRGGHGARSAFLCKLTVEKACERVGLDRLGVLTLTFADEVLNAKEASRRLDNFRRRVLKRVCPSDGWLKVFERQESGRVHYHLLVDMAQDIRTGFDFDAVKRGDYRSASRYLRKVWRYLRRVGPKYGFGRIELLPVKDKTGLAKYLQKYIAKGFDCRAQEDRGVRLWSCSRNWRVGVCNFAWAGRRARLWRLKVQRFAYRCGALHYAHLAILLGKRWAYFHRDTIMSLEVPGEPPEEQGRDSGAVRMNRPAIDAAKPSEACGVPAR